MSVASKKARSKKRKNLYPTFVASKVDVSLSTWIRQNETSIAFFGDDATIL